MMSAATKSRVVELARQRGWDPLRLTSTQILDLIAEIEKLPVPESRGVTNNANDHAKMLERRRAAGDVLAFSAASPRDHDEYWDGGRFSNNTPLPA
jgi:hypothetical protein